MENKILLSVCIPTFNGEKSLPTTIETWIKAIGNREDIELIISDNGSSDSSMTILERYEIQKDYVRVYRNEENLGYNGNLLKLIDEYSSGVYCWVSGDDDCVDEDAIDLLYPLLKKGVADFISLNFRALNRDQFEKFSILKKRELKCYHEDYFSCMEDNTSIGNVLNTFMSTHIFRLEVIKKMSKADLNSNEFNSYKTCFPNSYLMTNAFHDNKNCYWVKNKLLTAISRQKTYGDKWTNVVDNVLIDIYEYCVEVNGGKELPKTKLCVFDWNLRYSIIKFLRRDYNNIKWNYFLSYKTILCTLKYMKSKLDILLKVNLL